MSKVYIVGANIELCVIAKSEKAAEDWARDNIYTWARDEPADSWFFTAAQLTGPSRFWKGCYPWNAPDSSLTVDGWLEKTK